MPSVPDLSSELEAARQQGFTDVCTAAERVVDLPPGILLAVASRETNCRDIVGDGGHGRGLFQIDDRAHGDWLAHQGASAAGKRPPLAEAAGFAASLLVGNIEFGRRNGVAERDLLKFALSAYNSGPGNALAAYGQGDSDRRTTGRDYGADVLRRLAGIQTWLGGGTPATGQAVLHPGARGPAVKELKRLLKAWFGVHPPTPSLAANAVYGPAAVEAVRAFQRANGLDDDGIVGGLTWGALTAPAAADTRQTPPLPASVRYPDDAYPRPETPNGLQPWIVPQVQAICDRFGLTVTAGHGGHPPHAPRSDHAWGGAVDLAGSADAMVKCNLWADALCADPHRAGAVFRWVGGPAKDSSGVEPGHADHVHLSWYRTGPATTIFGTNEFR